MVSNCSDVDRLRVANGVLQEDNQRLKNEVEELRTQVLAPAF
jgi:hypothetical protein